MNGENTRDVIFVATSSRAKRGTFSAEYECPRRRSLASLGMRAARSVLHLRLEAEHPPERQIVIPRRPALCQLGPIDPEGQIQSGDKSGVADPMLRPKPDTGIADEPDPTGESRIARILDAVREIGEAGQRHP